MAENLVTGAPGTAVALGGRLTLATAQQTRETLLVALAADGAVSVVIDEACEVDVSFVQILEAGRILAERRGTRLTIRPPLPQPLAHLIADGGFAGAMAKLQGAPA